ncbi:transporter substrate-binding domain-containing protein [Microvirga aerophila]|uniref:Amino acid ABC transporter n=1 Tax=Microvirga aerophila TaxID=670291 RepID=A0A512BNF5_9HYPH|nr:transporter substrate-binding domain-containing protein [Microvirga aerophila]GEO13483.1 amino acid ABC transporter [Microvirga aerophila]
MNALSFGRHLTLLAGFALGLGSSLSAAAQDMAAPAKPVIRVAVEGAYPPFNYMDQSGELQGFEVDLLKALCDAMKAECLLTQHEWDGIIRGLINREYDAIMSSLEINERRRKRIAFSIPYYRIPASFIGQRDTDIDRVTPEGLAEKKIGTTDRSDHAAYLEQFYNSSEIQVYSKIEEANLDLLTGRLDAVFGDKLALSKFLESREGACCRIIADAPADPAFHYQAYGIGLRLNDQDLKARFDGAIAKAMADGTYDRIRAKYFSIDIK